MAAIIDNKDNDDNKPSVDNKDNDDDDNDNDDNNDATDIDTSATNDKKNKKKKKKKKKKAKWDIEDFIGSTPIKLDIKFDGNRGQDKLKKAGWWCNRRGKIMGLNGDIPKPNDCPETYLIQDYISFILIDYYKFKLVEIPINQAKQIAKSHIYLSNDYQNKKTLLLVIPGTGIVNAGEFATSICKFDNVVPGTAFPFIQYAFKNDYGVVLFDPNGLTKQHENILDKIHCVYVFDTYVKPYLSKTNVSDNDPNNTDNTDNTATSNVDVNTDNNIIDNDPNNTDDNKTNEIVENLLILAHSAGGRRTTYLLRERGDILLDYLGGIAFTDIKDPKQQVWKYEKEGYLQQAKIIKKIYKLYSRNWIKTKKGKALDSPMKRVKKPLCERVSAGHSNHKYTTPSAYKSILKYFDDKMST